MTQENKYDVSIVLAAYNEEKAIEQELNIIKNTMDNSPFSYELIVVDDASTDKTADIVRKFDWVKLIRHPINKGSGGARKTGTLAAQGEVIVWSDADLTYPNHDIPQLVSYLKELNFDHVVGARESEKGTLKMLRVPAKWFIRKLACILSGTNIPDLNSGLRAFKREIALEYLHLLPMGFSCVSTMTLAFLCNGYSVGYMPIEYNERVGRSKFHPIKDTYNYFMQVVRMIMYFNPLKIFLPLSLIIFLCGILFSVYHFTKNGTLQEMDIIILLGAVLIGVIGLLADLIVAQHRQ